MKLKKIPYTEDPMKEKVVFQLFGCVYICYAKKTRGRSMIRLLGRAETLNEKGAVPDGEGS